MADTKERLSQEGFAEAEVDAILQRAAELQSREQQGRLSQEALEAGAEAVGISEEFVEQAIRELKAERERAAAQQAAWRRRLTIGGLLAAGFLVVSAIVSYPALNARLAEVEKQRAQLENVLQRRQDLLRNLMALVGEPAASERELRDSIEALIEEIRHTPSFEERQRLEQKLSEAVRQASAIFTRFADEIAGAENRIAFERKRYNETVAAYNRTARSFPVFVVRPFLGFPPNLPYWSD